MDRKKELIELMSGAQEDILIYEEDQRHGGQHEERIMKVKKEIEEYAQELQGLQKLIIDPPRKMKELLSEFLKAIEKGEMVMDDIQYGGVIVYTDKTKTTTK